MPNLEQRCRRARYRAWRRGTKELDLLLGRFASWALASQMLVSGTLASQMLVSGTLASEMLASEMLASGRLNEAALQAFEDLLEEKDPDIYDWIMGATPPQRHQQIIERIRQFHQNDK